jgi:hypothetical protein
VDSIGKQLFSRKFWLNHSSLVDMQWLWLNYFCRTIIIVPLLGGKITFSLWVNKLFYQYLVKGNQFHYSVFAAIR